MAAGGRALRTLEETARRFGDGEGQRKLALLAALGRARLASADQVRRFHDVLGYLRALPDDARVLAEAERLLGAFRRRPDLRRHRAALEGSGIEGTDVRFPFFAPMARWLAERHGERLHVDWSSVEDDERLMGRVYLLALDAETPGLDHAGLAARAWVRRMKRPDETDAQYLVRRFGNVSWDPTVRDVLYDELDLSLVLRGGEGGPSKTHARLPGGRVAFQERPLRADRPDLRREIRRPPRGVRRLSRREGEAVVDLAKEAMAVRARDLDAFAGGDPGDVRIVDAGDGLELAVIGVVPTWRMLFECVYGWLILRNRVPTGYVLTSTLFGSAEVAYNVFAPWRGGDAAWVYGRVLAATRALFGTDTFAIDPYQLGHGNEEGLLSGAWWFYQKLGFCPRDPVVVRRMEAELSRMRRDPRHRSGRRTLERLVHAYVFLSLGRARSDVLGVLPLGNLGLAATDLLARRFGSDRDLAEATLADELSTWAGVRGWRRWPRFEQDAWRHWSPVLAALPGLDRWPRPDRRAVVEVVRAKGGPRESDFARRFDAHRRLRRALVALARTYEGGAGSPASRRGERG